MQTGVAGAVTDPTKLSRARVPYAEEYYDRVAYEVDPLGAYRMRRNQRLAHVSINAQGYRGRPFSGDETVLLLGDSVTFGVGASSDERVFARFLEAASGRRVADASVRGYRIFQHFIQLPRLLAQVPQVRDVVLWGGYTDLSYWVTTGGCVEGAFQFEWKYRGVRPEGEPGWRRRLRTLMHRWIGDGMAAPRRERGSLDDLATHVAAYLRGIRDLCAARELSLTVLLQPFVRSRPSTGPLQELSDLYDAKTSMKCGLGWYEAAPRFVTLLEARMRDLPGIRWIDCQPLVSPAELLDQVHLGEEALHRLANALVEQGWLRMERAWA